MDIKTIGDLIDWSRQLHEHLARCLAHCADRRDEERARMLLDYLADHEAELERVVAEYERRADPKALKTYVYDYLEHRPIRTHRTCDGHYASLDVEGICSEIFDFHDQVIDLYRSLVGKAAIPEAKQLLESLLELEEHEAMRLARQTGRMKDL